MIKKTAIIIGASGDIGKATAKTFSKNNFSVAVTFNKNQIDFDKSTTDFKSYKLDLTKSSEIEDFFKKVSSDFDYIDTLVFCSGIAQQRKFILDVTNEEIENLFDVNIISVIKCIREFTKITANKHPSNIVLVGSFVEKNGCSCESIYTATKSGLSGLCRSLSSELGNLDVRCNVVAPGFIDTKMNNNLTCEEKEEIANMTPLKRLGTCQDVANAIYFLSSENASFITGQTLYVDGGLILE